MDNENTTDDNVTYLYGKDVHDQMTKPFEVDDTVNIPQGEYQELIEDQEFLVFLQNTVGPEVWQNAQQAFFDWNEEVNDNDVDDGGTDV